jgi:hypothetical protein
MNPDVFSSVVQDKRRKVRAGEFSSTIPTSSEELISALRTDAEEKSGV